MFIMLLEFYVENFLSFAKKTMFSMVANKTNDLKQNLINWKDFNVLKTAAIYGANASGKSNLFVALGIISHMIKNSPNIDINEKLPIEAFKFNNSKKPSKFEIRFIKNKIKYVYGFSTSKEKIIEEYLYYYPNGRESKIFDRINTNDYSFPQKDTKVLKEIKNKTADNKFFLSTATNWNYEKTKPAYDFLTLDLEVCFNINELRDKAFSLYLNDKEDKLKTFALNFLKKADFNITDFEINIIHIPINIYGSSEKTYRESYQVFFKHNINKKDYNLNIELESEGTLIAFILIPFIYDAIKEKKVLIIDELDRSLHPFLVKYIVDLFNSPKNSSQLIFNTHDTNLLNLDFMRRDQIWFTEKDEKTGISDLYSLADFSVRKDENVEKGYLMGRYGAIPFIDNNLETWLKE